MKKQTLLYSIFIITLVCCTNKTKEIPTPQEPRQSKKESTITVPSFTLKEANTLIELPLHCLTTEYPNKLGQTIGSKEDLKQPAELHPTFYGCFDWHSAVHGYWSMVALLKKFPEMEKSAEIKAVLKKGITPKNIAKEAAYFDSTYNKSFERTYGWAWLLQLAQELHTWKEPLGQELAANLQPLTTVIIEKYMEFLPKLVYPIRVGEHTNTAFGFTLAYDYAKATGHEELKVLIEKRARDFYEKDQDCPLHWEPSGYDFLSPCLQEIAIMRRIQPAEQFKKWLHDFLPDLVETNFTIPVAQVGDRTDGKLVHLDGLNFSRAWVFYDLANNFPEYAHLKAVANKHVEYSYPNLVGDSYEGGHWLGSFAIYALKTAQQE